MIKGFSFYTTCEDQSNPNQRKCYLAKYLTEYVNIWNLMKEDKVDINSPSLCKLGLYSLTCPNNHLYKATNSPYRPLTSLPK